MSYGKDERDIHKTIWELPIPQFDPANGSHSRGAALGATLEKVAEGFDIDDSVHFAATRRHIREVLIATPEGQELNGSSPKSVMEGEAL